MYVHAPYIAQHVIRKRYLEATIGAERLAGIATQIVLQMHQCLLPLELQCIVVSQFIFDFQLEVNQL
jgi:hypothetical protein